MSGTYLKLVVLSNPLQFSLVLIDGLFDVMHLRAQLYGTVDLCARTQATRREKQLICPITHRIAITNQCQNFSLLILTSHL